MYSMVLLAALTASTDMPDFGRRGGCHGCYGGCYGGYGLGYGGWGGCYGGWGMGYGGGWGYGGFVNSGYPLMGGYAGTPLLANTGTAVVAGNMTNPAASQSFYYNAGADNAANEATIVVHVPEGVMLTVDGRPTQSRGNTRVFHSPPLAPGRTYTYELRAEVNQDGRFHDVRKTVEVRAGQRTEVTMGFDNAGRAEHRSAAPARANRAIEDDAAPRSFRTPQPLPSPDDQ